MKTIEQNFAVPFRYGVYFTESLFERTNTLLADVLQQDGAAGPRKVLVVLDSGVAEAHPDLEAQLCAYAQAHKQVLQLVTEPLILPGGEAGKNEAKHLQTILDAVHEHGICRHSYLLAIGGGALLDLAGFAAAIAHRGVRLVRIPTTVLSQNDSGVGVKNSVNAFGKKNFLGTFAPPFAVINDAAFLRTLHPRDWRAGISEAVKVALIKDAAFYQQIKQDAEKLNERDLPAMQRLIHRCAELHVAHIGGADPFEMGSSRPLDFGHWAAHKLEQLSNYRLRHGEAVAIGIALDVTYSYLTGLITKAECEDVTDLLQHLGFALFAEELLLEQDGELAVLRGLQEFQEHLGGQLTVMLLRRLGEGTEVHHMQKAVLHQAILALQNIQQPQPLAQV